MQEHLLKALRSELIARIKWRFAVPLAQLASLAVMYLVETDLATQGHV